MHHQVDINKPAHTIPSMHAMLQQLVAANSISSFDSEHDQSNKSVIHLLAQWAQDLGMETKIQQVSTDKFNLIATLSPTSSPVSPDKSTPKGLMFAGHTDTVGYNALQWHQDPFELHIIDNHWVGLGVCDMKGFFPLVFHAIAQAQEQYKHQSLQAPITILATCDEETTMAGARAFAQQTTTMQPHEVIIGEPSAGQAIYAHKGIMITKLTLSGIRGHASNPSIGANAIEAAHWVTNKILTWRQELTQQHHNPLFKTPHPTINFGCIHGGTNANVICDHCEILLDIRLLPNMTSTELHTQLTQRLQGLEQDIPDTSVKLNIEEYCLPFAESPDSAFFQFLEKSTGQTLNTCDFATEAPILQSLGHTPVVLGPGHINWAHKPNERLSLESLTPMMTTLLECLKYRWI